MGSFAFLILCISLVLPLHSLARDTPQVEDGSYLKVSIETLFRGIDPVHASSKVVAANTAHRGNAKNLAISLSHRDAPSSPYRPLNSTVHGLLMHRLKRDKIRLKGIAARLNLAQNRSPGHHHHHSSTEDLKPLNEGVYDQEDFDAALRSGLSDGSGEYFVTVGVGTPPRTVNLVADTGSDVLWIQCLPCQNCYGQTAPVYNPTVSSSFQLMTCGNPLCKQLLIRGCRKNQCLYQVSYGDGSFTVGDFSTETLFFGSDTVQNVAIGCGHNNQGLFTGAAGLLGLGKGQLSFPSQVGPTYGNVFSYCLPTRESSSSVPLMFGASAVTADARFTPLQSNPKLDTFYYVNLVGIKVGGNPIALPTNSLVLDSSGAGGVILDSGTAVTRLVTTAYNSLRDAFRAGSQDLKMTSGFSLFDTCYDLSGQSSVMLPAVVLEFEGGATMALPAQNIMVPVDDAGTYCFAFAPNSDAFSIVGNIQQQSFRMSFDSTSGRVGIAANKCS